MRKVPVPLTTYDMMRGEPIQHTFPECGQVPTLKLPTLFTQFPGLLASSHQRLLGYSVTANATPTTPLVAATAADSAIATTTAIATSLLLLLRLLCPVLRATSSKHKHTTVVPQVYADTFLVSLT